MIEAGAFVYLLDEEMVMAMVPDWPADMQVAVCLSTGGGCDLAVHHRDEVERVLLRIAALQGVAPGDLCVAPPVEGYPTRRVLFSEEQQLLSFVADSDNLAEMASDYALNLRFARDEGLDPDPVTPALAAAPGPVRAAPPPPMPQAPAESEPARLTSRSQAFVTHLSLPSGYAAPATSQPAECVFVQAHLSRRGDTVRLVIAPDKATGREVGKPVERLGWRDDFACFVLPRAALTGWVAGQAAVLDMPLDLFPDAVVARDLQAPRLCRITVTQRGIFVSPVAPLASDTAPAPQAKRKPRRGLRGVHVAVAVLVAAIVVTGHFAAALDRGPGTVTEAAYAAHPALDLVAAMTQETPPGPATSAQTGLPMAEAVKR